jgi:alanyl-tRNA synthetase
VRHGRLIGIQGEFTSQVAESAIALSESVYPKVRERADGIKAEMQREESQFLKTLGRGEKMLADVIKAFKKNVQQAQDIQDTRLAEAFRENAQQAQILGREAFILYDTYGFPLELTQEIAEEQGLTVDIKGFEEEMEKQRQRSQEAHETIDLMAVGSLEELASGAATTEFLGYTLPSTTAQVAVLIADGKQVESAEAGAKVQVVLDQTPFYAESGGQIGDRGYLTGEDVLVRIEDVKKEANLFVHFGHIERGTLQLGARVTAQIDRACRRRLQANHTATHLLQAALKQIVDPSISQAGSLVAFDRLRFDFHCPRAVTSQELQQIEEQVNTWIAEAHEADVAVMPIAEAKAKGAIAMFGEKYGDEVRVIDFPGVSMELCGGTHVSNTAEIGVFKIVSEGGVAAGIRRIEAVAGPAVLEYLNVRDKVVRELSDRFKVKPEELPERITNLQNELKTSQKQLDALKQELALAKSDQLLAQAESVGEFKILVANMGDVDPEALKTVAERLQQKLGESAIVLGSVPEADKVSLVAVFSKGVNSKGLQAGKFIGAIAKICGGGGGGRPNLAQAGGRDPSKLAEALDSAKIQLHSSLI